MSQVLLNGQPAETLLDRGLPNSIVSMELFLKIAATNWKLGHSLEEWGKEVEGILKSTIVSLPSYGGGKPDRFSTLFHVNYAVQVIGKFKGEPQ